MMADLSGGDLPLRPSERLRLEAEAADLLANLPADPDEEGVAAICLYRKRTINLLQRYAKLSMETGRLPSVLSGMEFQAKISSYPLRTFEDAVIFVFDVEGCLAELGGTAYQVVARVIFREEQPEKVRRELQFGSATIYRLLAESLDQLTEKFLERGILARSEISSKSCQEGKSSVFPVSS
jgi:hypothetical protein